MSIPSRELLRRVALGLPLVALPFGVGVLVTNTGCLCSCPDPLVFQRSVSDEDQAVLDDTTDPSAANMRCIALCESQILDAGGAEAGGSDGGVVFSRTGRAWRCTNVSEGVIHCSDGVRCIGGRAPQSLFSHAPRHRACSSLGEHFASMAHLESAAVPAFFELASEINLHGAPHAMSRAARHSARQEIVHARLVGRLARRFGGEVPVVQRGETAPRSLFDMAKDNAFEGCVREAYGALLAAHQATHARDPDVRSVFARIAKDEAEHALLSLALHDWARSRVSDAERRVLDETRDQGVASLHTTVTAEEPDRALALAGLPSATAAHDLARALVA